VTRLIGFGSRREVTTSGMKVRHGGVVDLHGGRMRKWFEQGTVKSGGNQILCRLEKLLKPSQSGLAGRSGTV
jgi:hypothetical protein